MMVSRLLGANLLFEPKLAYSQFDFANKLQGNLSRNITIVKQENQWMLSAKWPFFLALI